MYCRLLAALVICVAARSQQALVCNLEVTPQSSPAVEQHRFTVAGTKIYFDGYPSPIHPWVSDGTQDGTLPLGDFEADGLYAITPLGIGDEALFVLDIPELGFEIWRTNGTSAGTTLVKDIAPGPADGYRLDPLLRAGSRFYFLGNDSVHGDELWSTDGTTNGTFMVRDINPNPGENGPSHLTASGNLIFFAANDGQTGHELWKSDGTSSGTTLVAEMNPGPGGQAIEEMAAFQGGVLFQSNGEPWYSDGNTIVSLGDLNPGPVISSPRNFLDLGNGTALFVANDGGGHQVWRTNGTAAGTVKVGNFANPSSSSSNIGPLTRFGNIAVFKLTSTAFDTEPWRSDGTTSGTYRLADIAPGSSNPAEFAVVGSEVWFAATHPVIGREIFRTDGTQAGTYLKVDLMPGALPSDPTAITDLGDGRAMLNSKMGWPWSGPTITNGTNVGSTFLGTTEPRPGHSVPIKFTQLGNRVAFVAYQNSAGIGQEVFVTDGTAEGTSLVADLNPNNSSSPANLCSLGDLVVFMANDGVHGREMWATEGTAGATTMLTNNLPHIAIDPLAPTRVGSLAYCSLPAANGLELWRTDGTPIGTFEVINLNPGSAGSDPWPLTAFGSQLFFSATDGVHGRELWLTDGTAAGTTMMADIRVGAGSAEIREIVAFGDAVYFPARGTQGIELWQSKGTSSSTALFADVRSGPGDSTPSSLTVAGGLLFFTADDGSGNGRALWRTDGTAAGTVLVKDVVAGPDMPITGIAGTTAGLFFFVNDNSGGGTALFFSDGTTAGTQKLLDLGPSTFDGFQPDTLIPILGGTMAAFVANDLVHGKQVWVSGGTTDSTVRLSDIRYGGAGAIDIREMTAIGNTIYAQVRDAANGMEPWRFDIDATSIAFTALYSNGCQGSGAPALGISATGRPILGDADFGIRLTGPNVDCLAFLFWSPYPANFQLNNECRLALLPPFHGFAAVPIAANVPTMVPVPLVDSPSWIGLDFFWQWAVIHPNPSYLGFLQLSGGMQTHLGY